MNLISYYLIENGLIGYFPVISLILFLCTFSGVLWFIFKTKKSFFDKMGNLPLEN